MHSNSKTLIRVIAAVLPAALGACTGTLYDDTFLDIGGTPSSQVEETSDPPEIRGDLPEWSVYIDTSSTSSYVEGFPTTAPVSGRVSSPNGPGTLTVGGQQASMGADGVFDVDVPVEPGLHVVELNATDQADPPNSRRANVSLLVADYLPEGQMNTGAAALVLTDDVVGAMADPMQELVSSIDVASEIRGRNTLTDDGTCTTHPSGASHGTPTLSLYVSDAGELVLEVLIPNLRIDFYGSCSMFITSMDITGTMTTDVAIMSRLSAPPGDTCLQGLDHSPATVELRDFDLSVQGGSGLLESLIVMLVGEMSEGDTADTLKAEIGTEAESMLGPELQDITIFESSESMELLESTMDLDLCVTGLETRNGQLLAYVGATVSGEGGLDAPGAPMVEGELPPPEANSMYLDANLVSQMVFSAWRAGGLSTDHIAQIDFGLLALISRDLEDLYPEGTMIDVSLDGKLAPYVRAVDEGPGDLLLEIGNLDLILEVDGELLFRVGAQLTLILDLVPADGGLVPTVMGTTSDIFVAEEPIVDIDDDILASAVQLQIGMVAGDLLGDTAIALPDIGGSLTPVDVQPTPGGRYVQVMLE